jgi:hypothetical protein
MHKLASQSLHDSVEHRERSAPFEDPLRRFIVRRLALLLRDRWADRLKRSINDTMAVFTGILFQWRSPISKKRKRNWRMSETDDGQKARNACNIGTQPVRPKVYGVNAPL